MRGIGFAIYFVWLTACTQAQENIRDAISLPSLVYTVLPILIVGILMFWFQRAVQSKVQTKRQEESARKHERERERLARTLDRIIEARPKDPEGGRGPAPPESSDPDDREK